MIGYYGENEELAAFLPISTEKYLLVTKKNPAGVVVTDELAKKSLLLLTPAMRVFHLRNCR